MTLHEGIGFFAPDNYKEYSGDHEHRHNGYPIWCTRCNLPYALLNYDKCEVPLECFRGTTENPVWIGRFFGSHNFRVTRSVELIISFYLRDPNRKYGSREVQDIFIGAARAKPLDMMGKSESHLLKVEGGTGTIRVSFECLDITSPTLEDGDFKWADISMGKTDSGYLKVATRSDTEERYAVKRFPTTELISASAAASALPSRIVHPFIAPVTLHYQRENSLCLLSPYVSGGCLFNHLQKQRSFDIERSRFYTAETLCALEYLHDTHGIFAWLKPRNVLLDLSGHVTLCGFGLFISETKSGNRSAHGMPEYPAPELLLGLDEDRMADWWTLGIFLYEMLTGFPLFYDEDADKIPDKIHNQPIRFPESICPAAKDLIIKLLDRNPQQRLGARKGVSEIKAYGIDWHQILQRQCQPVMKPKPNHVSGILKQHGVRKCLEPERLDIMHSFALSHLKLLEDYESRVEIPESLQRIVQADDDWELFWNDAEPQHFYFYNHVTETNQLVHPRTFDPLALSHVATHGSGDDIVPSPSQKLDTLEAALLAGHAHVVSQLLEYGVDLNVKIFGEDRKSPLCWAVEHGNLYLVRLFLEKGADANFPTYAIYYSHPHGLALISAVKRGTLTLRRFLYRRRVEWPLQEP